MKRKTIIAAGSITLFLMCSMLVVSGALAQDNVPAPDPKFKEKVGKTYHDSQADPAMFKSTTAPEGAPDILLVMIDDAGFGATSTFGGPCQTPVLDKLAQGGLRYNNFHKTALCSPTRAALLTGHNHHSAATGVIMEMGTGFPGYTGIMPRSTAMLFVNGKKPEEGRFGKTIPARYGMDTFDIGMDLNAPVVRGGIYKTPYKITGTIDNVKIDLTEEKPK